MCRRLHLWKAESGQQASAAKGEQSPLSRRLAKSPTLVPSELIAQPGEPGCLADVGFHRDAIAEIIEAKSIAAQFGAANFQSPDPIIGERIFGAEPCCRRSAKRLETYADELPRTRDRIGGRAKKPVDDLLSFLAVNRAQRRSLLFHFRLEFVILHGFLKGRAQ